MISVRSRRGEASQGQAWVARADVGPSAVRPEVRILRHGWMRVWVGFRDLMGIDSSALGDGKSQRIDHRPSARRTDRAWPGRQDGLSGRAHRKHRLDGTNACPIEKFWWGESDLRYLGVLLFAIEADRV